MALITLVYMAILQSEFGALTERQFFSPIKMGKYSVSVSNIGRIDYIAVCAIIFPACSVAACRLCFRRSALKTRSDLNTG